MNEQSDVTKTIQMVATQPEPGDEVVLVNGKVAYRVEAVRLTPHHGHMRCLIFADRVETFREEPFTKTQDVVIEGPVWRDLVERCASTVSHAPPAA